MYNILYFKQQTICSLIINPKTLKYSYWLFFVLFVTDFKYNSLLIKQNSNANNTPDVVWAPCKHRHYWDMKSVPLEKKYSLLPCVNASHLWEGQVATRPRWARAARPPPKPPSTPPRFLTGETLLTHNLASKRPEKEHKTPTPESYIAKPKSNRGSEAYKRIKTRVCLAFGFFF